MTDRTTTPEPPVSGLSREIADDASDERLGPAELYGAVGVAMFKADLAGLPINRKINVVGNAAFQTLTRTPEAAQVEMLVEALEEAKRTIKAMHDLHIPAELRERL